MRRTLFHIAFISALLALLSALPGISAASFISMDTTTTASVSDNKTTITLVITNKGDEAAHNVLATVEVGGKTARGTLKGALGVKESAREEFNLPMSFGRPGRHPFIASVEYTDANLYPFTAISAGYLNYGDAGNARVAAAFPPFTVYGKGRAALKLTSTDEARRTFHVRVAAARELTIRQPELDIVLGPGEGKTVEFDVANLSALPGSSYPVFAVITYDDGERLYTHISTGTVEVKNEGFAGKLKIPLLLVLLLLAALAGFFYFRGRRG